MIYVLMRIAMTACMAIGTTLVADDCKGPEGGSTEGGGGLSKACDTRLERPVEASRPEGTVVRVYSVSTCDTPPQKHVVHLSIEHLTSSEKGGERGDWKPMPSFNGQTFRSCEAIPFPGSDVRCEWYVPCIVNGLYQARATVTGAGPDGRAFSFTVPEKPLARIECR